MVEVGSEVLRSVPNLVDVKFWWKFDPEFREKFGPDADLPRLTTDWSDFGRILHRSSTDI